MPICAATSFSGSSFACLATSRFFGIVMVSLISSVSGIDEPVDLYIVLVAGVDQRVEEILPRGPLAMQQVGALPVAVVTDDVCDQLRHGTAEGRSVGRYRLREVDGAHFRQKIGRPRARDPHQSPPVRDVEDADEPLVLYLLYTLCYRRSRSWCREQQPLAGTGAYDERTVRVAGGMPERDTHGASKLAVG